MSWPTVVSCQNLEGTCFLRPKKMPLLLTIFGRLQKVTDFPSLLVEELWKTKQIHFQAAVRLVPTSSSPVVLPACVERGQEDSIPVFVFGWPSHISFLD